MKRKMKTINRTVQFNSNHTQEKCNAMDQLVEEETTAPALRLGESTIASPTNGNEPFIGVPLRRPHQRSTPAFVQVEEMTNGRVDFVTSVHAIQNTRRKMEDVHVVYHDLNSVCNLKTDKLYSYYAVFDGHAGVDAASFAAEHLHQNLVNSRSFSEGYIEDAFKEAFAETDLSYLAKSAREGIKCGCTAVVLLIEQEASNEESKSLTDNEPSNKMAINDNEAYSVTNNKSNEKQSRNVEGRKRVAYFSWLGDSQAVLVRNGNPHEVTPPHKPDSEEERRRIEDEGGVVVYLDTWRVNGSLAVSRAIGDPDYKPYVCSTPGVNTFKFTGEEDFAVIACDGLWDNISPEEATTIVYQHLSEANQIGKDLKKAAQELAEVLTECSRKDGSQDNITTIVIFFKDPSEIVAQPFRPSSPIVREHSHPATALSDPGNLDFWLSQHSSQASREEQLQQSRDSLVSVERLSSSVEREHSSGSVSASGLVAMTSSGLNATGQLLSPTVSSIQFGNNTSDFDANNFMNEMNSEYRMSDTFTENISAGGGRETSFYSATDTSHTSKTESQSDSSSEADSQEHQDIDHESFKNLNKGFEISVNGSSLEVVETEGQTSQTETYSEEIFKVEATEESVNEVTISTKLVGEVTGDLTNFELDSEMIIKTVEPDSEEPVSMLYQNYDDSHVSQSGEQIFSESSQAAMAASQLLNFETFETSKVNLDTASDSKGDAISKSSEKVTVDETASWSQSHHSQVTESVLENNAGISDPQLESSDIVDKSSLVDVEAQSDNVSLLTSQFDEIKLETSEVNEKSKPLSVEPETFEAELIPTNEFVVDEKSFLFESAKTSFVIDPETRAEEIVHSEPPVTEALVVENETFIHAADKDETIDYNKDEIAIEDETSAILSGMDLSVNCDQEVNTSFTSSLLTASKVKVESDSLMSEVSEQVETVLTQQESVTSSFSKTVAESHIERIESEVKKSVQTDLMTTQADSSVFEQTVTTSSSVKPSVEVENSSEAASLLHSNDVVQIETTESLKEPQVTEPEMKKADVVVESKASSKAAMKAKVDSTFERVSEILAAEALATENKAAMAENIEPPQATKLGSNKTKTPTTAVTKKTVPKVNPEKKLTTARTTASSLKSNAAPLKPTTRVEATKPAVTRNLRPSGTSAPSLTATQKADKDAKKLSLGGSTVKPTAPVASARGIGLTKKPTVGTAPTSSPTKAPTRTAVVPRTTARPPTAPTAKPRVPLARDAAKLTSAGQPLVTPAPKRPASAAPKAVNGSSLKVNGVSKPTNGLPAAAKEASKTGSMVSSRLGSTARPAAAKPTVPSARVPPRPTPKTGVSSMKTSTSSAPGLKKTTSSPTKTSTVVKSVPKSGALLKATKTTIAATATTATVSSTTVEVSTTVEISETTIQSGLISSSIDEN
ncbi:Protein phosphatase 1E [Halotydeus destructor]|nr:Protein phosphatase 1E [Halotydeus destructor]